MMHSEETFLLSGSDGSLLWRRLRQISSRGCGGQPFAVADYNGDGRDDAASFHPSIFYILDGPSGRDLIAKDCTWSGVPMQPVYWGQPVALRCDGSNRPGLLFTTTGRSMIGLARADGSLAWSGVYDRVASGLPAIGDFDGDGRTDVLWIGFDDGSRCYDAASGRLLWKLPLGEGQNAGSAVSGDINGDGRDEAVFVLGQTLHCVGADGPGKPGRVLWTLDLPTRVSTPAIADAAGDGSLSILLAGADGNVYCVE
jgi:outer membrane protein assembly factor BamB